MLGIFRPKYYEETNCGRFYWWIDAWIMIPMALLTILTFGYLCAAWNVKWGDYYNKNQSN